MGDPSMPSYVWETLREGEAQRITVHVSAHADIHAVTGFVRALLRAGYQLEPIYPADVADTYRRFWDAAA